MILLLDQFYTNLFELINTRTVVLSVSCLEVLNL
jgi:hypothetical protein